MITVTRVEPRQRVVREPRVKVSARPLTRVRDADAAHPWALPILLLLLPMFGQTFYYLVEFPIPYALSKGWPFVVLPLSLYALFVYHLPYKALFALLLAYTIGVAPLLGMIYFGNGLIDSLTTTIKIWPFTYYFGFAALLAWLRPSARTITTAFIILGAGTYVLMWVLWLVVPLDWYISDPALGKLLMFEYERGYRIYMPMLFGMIFLFYLARRFCQQREWWTVVLLVLAFASLLMVFKQRISIMAAVIVVYAVIVSSTEGMLRRFLVAVGLLMASGVVAMLSGSLAEQFAESLGGSLSVRLRSIGNAIDYLGEDPIRWLFGVGGTTRFSTTTLADIFGDKHFFLADIGWLGIVFEYGLVGAAMLFAVYFGGLLFTWQTARIDGRPLIRALADYTFFLFLTSAVYSFVFTPGELATIVAVAAYLRSISAEPWVEPLRPVETVSHGSGPTRLISRHVSRAPPPNTA